MGNAEIIDRDLAGEIRVSTHFAHLFRTCLSFPKIKTPTWTGLTSSEVFMWKAQRITHSWWEKSFVVCFLTYRPKSEEFSFWWAASRICFSTIQWKVRKGNLSSTTWYIYCIAHPNTEAGLLMKCEGAARLSCYFHSQDEGLTVLAKNVTLSQTRDWEESIYRVRIDVSINTWRRKPRETNCSIINSRLLSSTLLRTVHSSIKRTPATRSSFSSSLHRTLPFPFQQGDRLYLFDSSSLGQDLVRRFEVFFPSRAIKIPSRNVLQPR